MILSMTRIYTSIVFIFLHLGSMAQFGQWTWMSGDSTLNSAGTRGVLGVPSVNNCPGARYEAMNFTDDQGNFWLYGGQLNDLVSGVHWYSDYPLGIYMGYTFGKIVARHGKPTAKKESRLAPEVLPMAYGDTAGIRLRWRI